MFKCRYLSKISLKKLRILTSGLLIASITLQLFLFTTSCIVVKNFQDSQFHSIICALSFISFIILVFSGFIGWRIRKGIGKFERFGVICTFIVLLSTAGAELYYAILISAIKKNMLTELSLCKVSEVFAQIYWDYKHLYSLCPSLSDCTCFSSKLCGTPLIHELYSAFSCNGLCGLGTKDCTESLEKVIIKISSIYGATLGLSFGFLMLCLLAFIIIIKKQKNHREELPFQAPMRNINEFEGISAVIEKSQGNHIDFPRSHSPVVTDIRLQHGDISSIQHKSYSDDSLSE
ncbi:hypothetical protein SteCoe_19381 [Stentor coeruleus]|uniref:Uncharacterized protein n=1 Tax=Stentor coeruleus TaxID=5963 RepID=A0A1R2BUF4_9CILI|nr:hypothetical protein SteCoe_19381 [Stentor coeruleus]